MSLTTRQERPASTLIKDQADPHFPEGAQGDSAAAIRDRQPPNRATAAHREPSQGERPGRLTWRDTSGTLRFVSVVTRDISDLDAFVECERPASIPLYRLVHFQVEQPARGRGTSGSAAAGKVLSAVYRVGPYKSSTGTPQGYALRLMVEPKRAAMEPYPRTADSTSNAKGGSQLARGLGSSSPAKSPLHPLGVERKWTVRFRSLPPVSREPEPEQLERRGDGVRRDLHVVHLTAAVLAGAAPQASGSCSSSDPGASRTCGAPPGHFLEVVPEGLQVRPNLAIGPKCVRKTVSGDHASIRSRLPRHFSTSMSGGGVGGSTYHRR